MSSEKILLYICVGAVCTIFLRALPFTLLGKKEIPDKIQYLGKILPPAIMAVLIVYCLKDVPVSFLESGVQKLIAVGVVAGTYLWKKNTFFSIILGTACYMILLHII